jgi:hypothetical protein
LLGFIHSLSDSDVEPYLKEYFGTSRDVVEFCKLYLEKRALARKTQAKPTQPQQQQQKGQAQQQQQHQQQAQTKPQQGSLESGDGASKKKKKGKRVDTSLLGFHVTQGSIVNRGGIDTIED